MIKLKNIVIDRDVIKASVVPEDSTKSGFLEIDIKKKEIISYDLPDGYKWCKNHIAHAKKYLLDLLSSDDIMPKEKLLLWH